MKKIFYDIHPMDCIKGAQKYLIEESIDLIITDPPYGIGGDTKHVHYNRKEKNVIDGYVEIPKEEYATFSKAWIGEAVRVLRPGGSIYIVSGYSNLTDILQALRNTCLLEVNHLIWKFNFGVYTSNKYISSHYHILYYVKPGGKVTFNSYSRFGPQEKDKAGRSCNYQDREDVWVINREYKHGEIKNKNELPMELIIKMMQYSSNQGDIIADFFLGGFNTAKVAIGMNRSIVGFEINSKAYKHHVGELSYLKPGYLLDSLRQGTGNRPANLRKRWTAQEKSSLHKRYHEIYSELTNKRQTIKILEHEFGRGYFSILRQLKDYDNSINL